MRPLTSVFILLQFVSALFADDRPSFVFIFTDDQGYADVGCYGSETPAIDSLASDGIRFNQFYAPFAICTPSHFGVHTGRNPSRSRDHLLSDLMSLEESDKSRGLQAGETTLPSVH